MPTSQSHNFATGHGLGPGAVAGAGSHYPHNPKTGRPVKPVPFNRSLQLCHALVQEPAAAAGAPSELHAVNADEPWLPGYPRVPPNSDALVRRCLHDEMATPLLNRMLPYLWLVASPSSAHISPLTEQLVRGRDIVVSQNPQLHLVWASSRVWIKPIPEFLLSHDFWAVHLADDADEEIDTARRACLGFMRTYYHLIKHRSDFRIARQHELIPDGVDFASLITFLTPFGRDVHDNAVSPRYRYGQLRLTRLNAWAPLSLHRWHFHKMRWQYADVFSQFYAPVLLVFGFLSIILAAMQVGNQARPAWDALASVSAWFSVASLLVVVAIGVVMVVLLAVMLLRELLYALRKKMKR
jgi:hypothetical protein